MSFLCWVVLLDVMWAIHSAKSGKLYFIDHLCLIKVQSIPASEKLHLTKQWCLDMILTPIASKHTCMGAIFGGSIRPASSPCVMMIPPTKRVLIAHDVCQTYSLCPFSSVNCTSIHFEQLNSHWKDHIKTLRKKQKISVTVGRRRHKRERKGWNIKNRTGKNRIYMMQLLKGPV